MESDISSINVENKLSFPVQKPSLPKDFEFPKKKEIDTQRLKFDKIKIITNYSQLFIKSNDKSINIFSINLESRDSMEEGKDDKSLLNLILNKIREERNFTVELEKLFNFYTISGHNLFGQPKFQDFEEISFKIYYDPVKKSAIVTALSESHYYEKGEMKEFLLQIVKVTDLRNLNRETEEVIRRFINIQVGVKLVKKDYIKSLVSRKRIFHKNFDRKLNDLIQIEEDKFYSPGYQVASNYYEHDALLLKIVPRFRLFQFKTFSKHFQDLCYRNGDNNAIKIFIEDCKGAKGLKIYDQLPVKIDGVSNEKPEEIYFENSKGEQENLIQYYLRRYNLNMKKRDVSFMLFFIQKKKNYQTGEREEKKLYFFPELLYVVGYLSSELGSARPRTLIQSPTDKLNSIWAVMRDLNQSAKVDESSAKEKIFDAEIKYEPLKTEAIVLEPPQLEFRGAKISPDSETGRFYAVNEPVNNKELINWLIILYECRQSEGNQIYQYLLDASVGLKMTLHEPKIKELKYIQGEDIRYQLDNEFYSIYHGERNKKVEDRFEIIFFFTSKRINAYSAFKDSFYSTGFGIPSQLILKENALKGKTSYFTDVLFQTWAKRDLTVWRIKMDSCLKDTVIISYSVTRNNLTGRNLTTVGITVDKYFSSMIFCSKYDEGEGGFISTNIQYLFLSALQLYVKVSEKSKIDNIIIYREGLNETQRSISQSFEFGNIMQAVQEFSVKTKMAQLPKICMIYVNKICDTKLFAYDENMNQSVEGIEHFSLSQHNKQFIYNVPVGTLIDHTIVTRNLWEFYLNSSYSPQGTNNPTHYIISHDSTTIPPEVIYKTTYFLCYTYFNTSKSIRFPSPLHRVIRRNQFIIKNITGELNKSTALVDISL